MAFPTNIDLDVIKASTSAEPSGVAISPAVATSNLLLATSQALALAAHNATAQQHQSFLASQAALMQSVLHLYHGEPTKVFA